MQIITTRQRYLLVPLTSEDLRFLSLQMADTFQSIAMETERQKYIMGQIEAEISHLKARLIRLSALARQGAEYHAVVVETYLNNMELVQEIRTDTGEVITTRPPTDRERQLGLLAEGDTL